MGSGIQKSWESPVHRDIKSVGTQSISSDSYGSTIGLCTEVYPDFLMAKIESNEIGTRVLPYSSDSGIRIGSTVRIEITSNIPRVTKTITYGVSSENKVLFNLDAGLDESGSCKYLSEPKDTPPWGEDKAPQISSSPLVIKHIAGEKVYNVDLAGLKLGHTKVSLFYHPQARIELSKNLVHMYAVNFTVFSAGGTIRISEPDKSSKAGAVKIVAHEKDDEDMLFGFVREYRGDVQKSLSDENISIDYNTVPGDSSFFSEAAYCMIVLDSEINDYVTESKVTTHTYKNRKLTVNNPEGENEKSFHKELLKKAQVDEASVKSLAIECEINGKVYPITYLKMIGRKGDVYEFTAGKKIDVYTSSENINLGDRSDFVFGDYSFSSQKNVSTSHYPVKDDTSNMYEFFGTTLRNMKGKSKEQYYKELHSTAINTIYIHEVDKASGIATVDYTESPIITGKYQVAMMEYANVKDSGASLLGEQKRIVEGESTTESQLTVGSSAFRIMSTNKGEDSTIGIGSGGAEFTTPQNMRIGSSTLLIDTDFSQFSGKAIFQGGIHVEKDFYIAADNIHLVAKEMIYLNAKKIYSEALESFVVSYREDFQAFSSKIVIENNRTLMNSGIFLRATTAHIQGEVVNAYGGDSITVSALKFATFGAENTTIFGANL